MSEPSSAVYSQATTQDSNAQIGHFIKANVSSFIKVSKITSFYIKLPHSVLILNSSIQNNCMYTINRTQMNRPKKIQLWLRPVLQEYLDHSSSNFLMPYRRNSLNQPKFSSLITLKLKLCELISALKKNLALGSKFRKIAQGAFLS